ncbi:MAG TPA: hypothetical protein PKD58_00110 [Candidatus Sumerlaeota bacterium]|nr:hypothetical protein [Candidatus Sumerlaeota bacterium]HMZ50847.1 hypothetical protein [Candidatus Sumerlaeota bacterium]
MKTRILAALMLAAMAFTAPATALQVTPVDDSLVSVTTSSQGDTRDAALVAARQQAVLASAGRVLLDDNLIRADDLLANYLRKYADNFVKSVDVTSDKFTGTQNILESRVYVDYERLVKDMTEKRFIYRPAYQPLFATFIDEKLDGQKSEQEPARRLVENAFSALGVKFYPQESITDVQRGVNLMEDTILLDAAVVTAERHNVELLVTGTASTTLREEKDLYYDHYYFYDCDMKISLVRVDTGEVLAESTARGQASNKDRALAITGAIDRAARPIATEIVREYKKFWPKVVQGKTDYEVLLTGVTDEQLNIVRKYLGVLGPESTVDVKKKFATSAVLSIKTTATEEQLQQALKNCTYPVLNIVREKSDDKLEVQVSG